MWAQELDEDREEPGTLQWHQALHSLSVGCSEDDPCVKNSLKVKVQYSVLEAGK